MQFVLEPLYKLVTQVISAPEEEFKGTLEELGIHMRRSEHKLDPKPMIRLTLSRFFGQSYHGLSRRWSTIYRRRKRARR